MISQARYVHVSFSPQRESLCWMVEASGIEVNLIAINTASDVLGNGTHVSTVYWRLLIRLVVRRFGMAW